MSATPKWSNPKRCNCKDPETGKEAGRNCPKFEGQTKPTKRHPFTYGYDTRIPVSTTKTGVRELRRFGFTTKTEADAAAEKVWDLIKLAGDDVRTQQKIGDLIFEKSARGGELPAVDVVRRRLGLRRDPGAAPTFGEAWDAWLAGKRKARPSYRKWLDEICPPGPYARPRVRRAYPEHDPRSLRSGTWQTIRMARKAGNFSQWHCVKPPCRGMIEEWPRDLLGDGVLADDPACERPRAVASGMTLSLAEHAKHVDTILRGSSLTPDAQVSLRVVLAEQNLCTEACLAMFHHLAEAGSGGWSAQWAFVNDKLKSVGYPPAD